ncbi:hypothetical protein DITRI_Ditri17bG0024700 [Diplodiscus trichospermus]
MINGLCKEGLPDEAYHLFRTMGDNGCLPNSCSFNVMIQGLLRNSYTSKAIQLLEEMVDKGFSVDASTAILFVDLISLAVYLPLLESETAPVVVMKLKMGLGCVVDISVTRYEIKTRQQLSVEGNKSRRENALLWVEIEILNNLEVKSSVMLSVTPRESGSTDRSRTGSVRRADGSRHTRMD